MSRQRADSAGIFNGLLWRRAFRCRAGQNWLEERLLDYKHDGSVAQWGDDEEEANSGQRLTAGALQFLGLRVFISVCREC